MKTPNPKTHLQISLTKSLIRIIAGVAILTVCPVGGTFIILAEMLGVLEELF